MSEVETTVAADVETSENVARAEYLAAAREFAKLSARMDAQTRAVGISIVKPVVKGKVKRELPEPWKTVLVEAVKTGLAKLEDTTANTDWKVAYLEVVFDMYQGIPEAVYQSIKELDVAPKPVNGMPMAWMNEAGQCWRYRADNLHANNIRANHPLLYRQGETLKAVPLTEAEAVWARERKAAQAKAARIAKAAKVKAAKAAQGK